jgi:hypothetical protein
MKRTCRFLAALGMTVAPLAMQAQGQARMRMVEGRVVRPLERSEPQPVAGQWVVLHRVGSDRAGPLDSVRSGRNGAFRFRYEATGAPDALYFVSAMYGGIAYFSPPLRTAAVQGGDAEIVVYDTTRDTSSLRVQGRHIVVSQARGPRRQIAEIFEIENQSARTVVASDSVASWTTALPDAADSVTLAPGDISAAAVRFERGRALLFAPLAPGVRQVVLTYVVPNDAFPLSFPLQRATPVLEVLLEDPRGTVAGAALREMEAATIEGRTFRRLLGQDIAASAVVRIDMPAPPGAQGGKLGVVIGTVAAFMLLGIGAWFARRGRSPRPVAVATPASSRPMVEQLVAQLAALDAEHERAAIDPAEYARRRAALKAELQAALAEGSATS